jgi:hypothetical protein
MTAAGTDGDLSANGSAAKGLRGMPGGDHPGDLHRSAKAEGGLRLISLRDRRRFRPLDAFWAVITYWSREAT